LAKKNGEKKSRDLAVLTGCNIKDQSATPMAVNHLQCIDIHDRPDFGGEAFRKAILLGTRVRGVPNGDKRAEEGKESSRS
jgi:hypothetical protein